MRLAATILGLCFVSGCKQKAATAAVDAAIVAPVAADIPDERSARVRLEQIRGQKTLSAAVAAIKPDMGDTANEDGLGFGLLGVWAMKSMRWKDVDVDANETSPALVQKDPDEGRGKRLCAPGTVIQIALDKSDFGKGFVGLFTTEAGNIFRFFAVGSTGSLVERSQARLCGVVTGKYDYANSGGGVGHAIAVVGMFDLPENRKVTSP